jgi:hypothetical protein
MALNSLGTDSPPFLIGLGNCDDKFTRATRDRLNAKCGRLRVGREIADRVKVSAAQVGDRHSAFGDVFEREVAVEIRRHNKELLEFDVTRCGSADPFAQTNFDIASAGEGEVSLDRAQTIVRGVPSCTFRCKFAAR